MKEPIKIFKSAKELQECKDWWIEKLQLKDWNIVVGIGKCEDDNNHGENETEWVGKSAMITIERREDMDDFICKQYEEIVLVHELLHCKIMLYEKDRMTIEEFQFMLNQHQLIEQMAKALIMTKYNLTFDWFKNAKGGNV